MADFSIQNVDTSLLIFDYQNIGNSIKPPTTTGTAVSVLGFDADGNAISATIGDATETEKGIVQLAGDLHGTADAPKIKKPDPGSMTSILGFDSTGLLVTGNPSGVADATTTTTGVIQLAGDLEGTATSPKLKKPSSGTATSFIGFDSTGTLVSDVVPDATLTTKGIVQLAGDLEGTATAPKLKKPSSGTATSFIGFDSTGTLVSDVVPDATLTTKGIVQLAGDLEGTATSPKLKKPSSGTATSFIGFDSTGTLVSDSAATPDATTTSKGIIQLAGDLKGTAASPAIKEPAPGTIVLIAGFDSTNTFIQSDISKAKQKTLNLRRYTLGSGSLQSNTTVYILNSATQQTTYNSIYPLDTTTSTFVTTGNIKHIKELLLDSYLQMRWITIRIVVTKDVADFPNSVVIVASLNRVSDLSPVAQTSLISSSFMSSLTMEITTFALGATDPFVTGGYFLTLHHNDGVAMSYSSITITAFASDDKIN